MTLTVRLFAGVRERIGKDSVSVRMPAGSSAADLRTAVAGDHPEAAGLIARCAVAVNGEYAAAELPVCATDEIALIPPVSGG